MSTNPKVMHSMRCDHPDGCSAELETYDGGSWLYDTAEEARSAARDYDWVTDGERDFCDRHRDDLTEPADPGSEVYPDCQKWPHNPLDCRGDGPEDHDPRYSADPSFCPPLAPGDDETCTHTPACPTGSAEPVCSQCGHVEGTCACDCDPEPAGPSPTHEHRCGLGHTHPIVKCRCADCGEVFQEPGGSE